MEEISLEQAATIKAALGFGEEAVPILGVPWRLAYKVPHRGHMTEGHT